MSIERTAKDLNENGIPSPGGGRWHIATVQRALHRMAK
jgi:hypothetical protein